MRIAHRGAAAIAIALASLPLAAPATPSPVKSRAVPAPSRSRQEAAFLRTVNRKSTASVITGDLPSYAGSHVAYTCDVDEVHRKGVIVGQCGPEAEPVGLFIEMPNVRVQTGQRVRVLGILEPPVPWTDIFGHTVYYAFVRAVFVDRLPRSH